MANWNANTAPKCKPRTCSDEVLATVMYKYRGENVYRVVKAVYIPYKHCTTEDMCWTMLDGVLNDWEYNEDDDGYWVPEGWYEVCDYFEDYSYSEITDKVIAWSKLLKPYEPRVKEF